MNAPAYSVDVERDDHPGKWWVTIAGQRVSDHVGHAAARAAARGLR